MDFQVNKTNLQKSVNLPSPPLSFNEGDILIRVEKFAFTANNVSYAATGDALGYWNFFPSSLGGVWGTGTVVASRCSTLKEQQKVYGYFPMSHYVILHPVNVTPADFMDGLPHRKSLPAVYNQYLLCEEDPFYTPRTEEAMMVLRPLFFTSWLLLDFFTQMDFNEAKAMIISSSSSKTSIGLAFLLHQHNQQKSQTKMKIIALTSPRNQQFVQDLGLYDEIILYNDIQRRLNPATPACFVDMAGNTQVTTCLHKHLQENMKYSCLVGAAHVGQGGKPTSELPGARPKFFFAPSWTAQRIVELGDGSKDDAISSKRRGMEMLLHNVQIDYHRFVRWCLGDTVNYRSGVSNGQGWMKMKHYFGLEQVREGYDACLKGQIAPNTAVIMSLWDSPDSPIRSKI